MLELRSIDYGATVLILVGDKNIKLKVGMRIFVGKLYELILGFYSDYWGWTSTYTLIDFIGPKL